MHYKLFYYSNAMQKDFTIEMHYEKIWLRGCITNDFYFRNALQKDLNTEMHYKGFYYKNGLEKDVTTELHY